MREKAPEGWASIDLADLARPSKERSLPAEHLSRRYLSLEHIEGHTNRVLGSADSSGVKSVAVVFHEGDVLYGKLRPYLNKVAIAPFDGIGSTEIIVFPRSAEFESKWLLWFLTRPETVATAHERSEGMQLPRVTFEKISDLSVPLPPLAEQRRIVVKVESLLAEVNLVRDRLWRVREILKRLRQSVLLAACSGKLTEEWREERGWRRGFPFSWKVVRIEDLFEVQSGGTPLRSEGSYYRNGTIPWLRTGEVRNADIMEIELKITKAALSNSNAKLFPARTIVVALYGDGRTRGQVGRLSFPAATNQACAALVNAKLPPETNDFVFFYLMSQYERFRSVSAGGNQQNLSLGIIKRWALPLPPQDEQAEIVSRVRTVLEELAAVAAITEQAQSRADVLTQSILAKAFRGELVPTEAALARQEGRSYEPASVLLERIKAEQDGRMKQVQGATRSRSSGTAHARVRVGAKIAGRKRRSAGR